MEKMQRLINGGKNNLLNGLMAVLVLSLIVLGCTCNETDGFQFGKNTDDSSETNERKDDGKEKDSGDAKEKVDVDFRADDDEVPTNLQVQALVEKTLLDFNDAVKKENFTDFHSNLSRGQRRATKVADYEKSFKVFMDKNIDISAIEDEEPEFSPKPYIDKKYRTKILFVNGKYETSRMPVNFELEYMVDSRKWKLVSIRVDTRR
jgi:hypothetical protein